MGLFDIIELKQHCRAIGEYVLFMDSHPNEASTCYTFIREHLKNMYDVLAKLEKNN